MKLAGDKFPKEMLLCKVYNSVVELLVLYIRCQNIHGFKSNWMNEHLHLVDVAHKTLALGRTVA